ncbi:MAG: hypothetical protein GXN92_00510 [Candidatus Micrarchaeota archaeon]|nr:hypothetical protein [Candidatus Micrarchaeota archaeon]
MIITYHYLHNPVEYHLIHKKGRAPNIEEFKEKAKKYVIEDYLRQFRVGLGILVGEGNVRAAYWKGKRMIYLRLEEKEKMWFNALHELTHHFQHAHNFHYTITEHLRKNLLFFFWDGYRRLGPFMGLKLSIYYDTFYVPPDELDALITEYMVIDPESIRRWERRVGIKEGTTEKEYQEWFGGVRLGNQYAYLLRKDR